MEIKDAIQKRYDITLSVKGVKSLKVTFPYEVVEREARKRDLSVEEFLEKFQAIAQYDSIEGVLYIFKEREVSDEV